MMDIIKDFARFCKFERINTDNNVFKLHYRFSVVTLMIFSMLLSSRQYFGEPILCDVKGADQKLVNALCWVSGTFIVEDYPVDLERYYVQNGVQGLGFEKSRKIFSLLYYQWIAILFCFQALLFYIPRYLWKSWEGGRLGNIVNEVRLSIPSVPEEWITNVNKISSYILSKDNHNVYAYRFAFCELLNLLNLILQFFFMNWYLEGHFLNYGVEVVIEAWPNAYNKVFPKKTKCLYTKFGPSGSITVFDALCVLPLNTLNEKFFLILWFWLGLLFLVTFGALIYRLKFLCSMQFRTYLMRAQVLDLSEMKARKLGTYLSHGQMFLLYNIGKNINVLIYEAILLKIVGDIQEPYINEII